MHRKKEDSPPRVSVIIPVYNGALYLSEAIASIRAQHYSPLEIIIVDDGSTDETATVVADLGADLLYIHQNNQGPAAARNRGLARATGDVIAFLDADDLWPPNKLELQISQLALHLTAEVILGRTRTFATTSAAALEKKVEDASFVVGVVGSAIFRRSVLTRVGGFDETLRFSEDHDWFLRAREMNVGIWVIPEVTLLYRVHSHNMTRAANRPRDFELLRVLRRSLQRRQQQDSGTVRALPPLGNISQSDGASAPLHDSESAKT